jgi:hypothetical protein
MRSESVKNCFVNTRSPLLLFQSHNTLNYLEAESMGAIPLGTPPLILKLESNFVEGDISKEKLNRSLDINPNSI